MKIVSFLAQQGFIDSQRGPGGGVRLLKSPVDINIGEVIRATEFDLELVECFGAKPDCRLTPACQLKNIFAQALDAFLDSLGEHHLGELLEPRQQLIKLLLAPARRQSEHVPAVAEA
jgi:Rrf2 family nitric oxide-sensitive transcriptional repressor